MRRGQVLDDDDGEVRVFRERGDELLQGIESARARTDRDDPRGAAALRESRRARMVERRSFVRTPLGAFVARIVPRAAHSTAPSVDALFPTAPWDQD